MVKIAEWGKVAALVGGAIGAFYLSTYLPKKLRPIPSMIGIGALGYAGYTVYQMYKPKEEGEGELPRYMPIAPSTERGREIIQEILEKRLINVAITDPSRNENWSYRNPHTINVEVVNRSTYSLPLWIGVSLKDPSGKIYDLKVKMKNFKPGQRRVIGWCITPPGIAAIFGCQTIPMIGGVWYVRASAWNAYPTPGKPDLYRLGDSDWIPFRFSFSGWG